MCNTRKLLFKKEILFKSSSFRVNNAIILWISVFIFMVFWCQIVFYCTQDGDSSPSHPWTYLMPALGSNYWIANVILKLCCGWIVLYFYGGNIYFLGISLKCNFINLIEWIWSIEHSSWYLVHEHYSYFDFCPLMTAFESRFGSFIRS